MQWFNREVNYLVARQKSVVLKVEGEPVPPQPRRLRDAVVRDLQSGRKVSLSAF